MKLFVLLSSCLLLTLGVNGQMDDNADGGALGQAHQSHRSRPSITTRPLRRKRGKKRTPIPLGRRTIKPQVYTWRNENGEQDALVVPMKATLKNRLVHITALPDAKVKTKDEGTRPTDTKILDKAYKSKNQLFKPPVVYIFNTEQNDTLLETLVYLKSHDTFILIPATAASQVTRETLIQEAEKLNGLVNLKRDQPDVLHLKLSDALSREDKKLLSNPIRRIIKFSTAYKAEIVPFTPKAMTPEALTPEDAEEILYLTVPTLEKKYYIWKKRGKAAKKTEVTEKLQNAK